MKALLQHWVTEQAERRSDALAIVMGQERMTYGELEQLSNRLARLLRAAGCRRGDRVCFLMPKSPEAIVSILGILKADCMHVPLDPASPAIRLARIVRSCDSRWILSTASSEMKLYELLSEKELSTQLCVGWLDNKNNLKDHPESKFSKRDLALFSGAVPTTQNCSEDAAHILFTSGSTGLPKGVVITHANVMHIIEWAVDYFRMNSSDRNSGHPPLHFDLSQFDIFGTFASGAELHLVPPELSLMPNKLAEFIRASELTQWFSVPSVLNYMAKFDVVATDDFPSLKRLLWCGETFPTPALIYWMKRLPKVQFTNLYGPTETTIASSYYTLPECPSDSRAAVPIGTACRGEELLVLNQELQPVGPGEIGDLYIAGVGLSPGYWNDPEKTNSAFTRRPGTVSPDDRIYKTGDLAKLGEDGLVYYIGRSDSQIKSRGYRIELGEIEAALNALDQLKECAVVAIPSEGFEGMTICAAYVSAKTPKVEPTFLERALRKTLPTYMLPTRWMTFDQLPKNSSGKIDKPLLRSAFQQDGAKTIIRATQAA